MRFFLSSFIFISLLTSLISQDKIVYHFKDKHVLHKLGNTFAITFDKNVSDARIKAFTDNLSDKNSSTKAIVKLSGDYKTAVIQNEINLSKLASMFSNKDVVYYTQCFGIWDKVHHYPTGEIIVKFRNGFNSSLISSMSEFYQMKFVEHVESFNDTYVFRIQNKGEEEKNDVFDVAASLTMLSYVEFAQPNFIRVGMLLSVGEFTKTPFTPNDSLLSQMWHVENRGNNIPENITGIPGCDMNLKPAWDITRGNPNVILAMADTGIDTNHTDLRANLTDRNLWYDSYEKDQTPWDEHSHGTGTSGTCGAVGNNFIGTAGSSFGCKIMPVRVFGPAPYAPTSDLILGRGLNWCWQHGASVINCSWGGGIPSALLTNAIRNARMFGRNGRGTVVFGGAGNADTNIIIYPASLPEVIGVGGLSPCNQRKSKVSCDNVNMLQEWGACYGEGLSLVAPCAFIGTTTLLGGWCICGNGTSCASPLAAGVGALVISKNINLSADSVKLVIERSARKVGNYSYNIMKQNGLWNNEMGYGRIDARAALDLTPPGPTFVSDMVPPIIKFIPPESRKLIFQFNVTGNISDNQLVAFGNNVPRLYYFTSQNPSNGISLPVSIQGNNYTFNFPLMNYGTRMFYYIAAQDTSSNYNVITYPPGGKGANPPGTIQPLKLLFFQNTTSLDTSFSFSNLQIPIATLRETTIVSTKNISTSKTILDVVCGIDITHTYPADLTVSLISPQGTESILCVSVGYEGDNFTNTFFDDEATIRIDSSIAVPPFTGTYKPQEPMWFFDGENSGGDWKLVITDNAYGDGGFLNSWGLTFKFSDYNEQNIIPTKFSLVKNYPNPFNPKTRIVFNVARTSKVRIALYDVTGRLVGNILNETRQPKLEDFFDFDSNDLSFNGGRGLASGIYFYSMYAEDEFIESKKMILLK